MRGFLSFLLDLLIPRSCLACGCSLATLDLSAGNGVSLGRSGRMDEFLGVHFTLEILEGISVNANVLCPRCWRRLEPAGPDGFLAHPGLAGGGVPLISPFYINDQLLALVRFLKFSGGRTAVPSLGWWVAAVLGDYLDSLPRAAAFAPLLVPVPLHRSREKSRGYNQASLLAWEVAEKLALEVDSRVVTRIKNTKSQSTLEAKKRAENVEGAFELLRPDQVNCRNVIVVDDLVTTGETARACVDAVARAHPSSITVLSAGRVRG